VGYGLYLLSEVYRIASKVTEMLCSLTFLVLLSYSIIRHKHKFAQIIIKVTNDGQSFYVWQALFLTRTLGYVTLSYPRRMESSTTSPWKPRDVHISIKLWIERENQQDAWGVWWWSFQVVVKISRPWCPRLASPWRHLYLVGIFGPGRRRNFAWG